MRSMFTSGNTTHNLPRTDGHIDFTQELRNQTMHAVGLMDIFNTPIAQLIDRQKSDWVEILGVDQDTMIELITKRRKAYEEDEELE